jgi:hypothetical protein
MGELEATWLLVKCGASIELETGDGETAASLAAESHHTSIVELLNFFDPNAIRPTYDDDRPPPAYDA